MEPIPDRDPRAEQARLVEMGFPPRLVLADEAAAAAAEPAPQRHEAHLQFDGSGSDYFRIWVVQTLLNVLTLGLYSPWAKVRKARWFAQHTLLLGHRFDYHGRPLPILFGRAVALALFAAWTFSFQLSAWLGFAVFAILCLLGPLLFASAQRFRFANTSWRGLRFGFHVPRARLYLVCVPALCIWTVGTLLQAAAAPPWAVITVAVLATFGFPLAHARLKAMQHTCASFAGERFRFDAATGAFYGLYVKAGFVMGGAGFVAGLVVFALTKPFSNAGPNAGVAGVLVGIAVMLLTWTLTWPYFAARMQAIVWPRTHWKQVGFRGDLAAWRLMGIVLKGSLLTLLTLGLAWPFLAVAVARYRVESLAVHAPEPLEGLDLNASASAADGTVGDAAADFFGLDLGW